MTTAISNKQDKILSGILCFICLAIALVNTGQSLKQIGKIVSWLELLFIIAFLIIFKTRSIDLSGLKKHAYAFSGLIIFIVISYLSYNFIPQSIDYQGAGRLKPSAYRLFFIYTHIVFFLCCVRYLQISTMPRTRYLTSLLISSTLASLYIFAYLILGPELTPYEWFWGPPLGGHIRFLSFISSCGIILCISLFTFYQHGQSPKLKAFLVSAAILNIALLLFSAGRAGILAVIITSCLMLALSIKQNKIKWQYAVATIIAASLLGLIYFSFAPVPELLASKSKHLLKALTNLDNINLDRLMSGRLVLWQAAIDGILNKPFLGNGPNAFFRLAYEGTSHIAPHNFFLLLLLEWGIIAGITIVILIGSIFTKACCSKKEPYTYTSIFLFINIMICALFSVTFYHSQSIFYVLITFAIMFNLEQASTEPEE